LIAGVAVGMILPRQLAIRLFDLVFAGVALDTQRLVVIAGHGSLNLSQPENFRSSPTFYQAPPRRKRSGVLTPALPLATGRWLPPLRERYVRRLAAYERRWSCRPGRAGRCRAATCRGGRRGPAGDSWGLRGFPGRRHKAQNHPAWAALPRNRART